jgi:3-oxoacyl-[acyl-carrier protein] reductase
MSQPLAGKTALVTGGSRGIGRAIVLKLASAGCDIAIVPNSRRAEQVCASVARLAEAKAIQADVSQPEGDRASTASAMSSTGWTSW